MGIYGYSFKELQQFPLKASTLYNIHNSSDIRKKQDAKTARLSLQNSCVAVQGYSSGYLPR